MSWIPLFAWLAAVVIAAALLGFCAYEISWKSRRLRRDLGQLRDVGAGLSRLQADAADVQQRLARAGLR